MLWFSCLFKAPPSAHGAASVLLGSEWCCLASVRLLKLPSIALLHQRTDQAPRSRYTVAPRRADSHRGPGRCDGGGSPEDGGQRDASGSRIYGLLRGRSAGCGESLNKVRHTQAHAHHKRACVALQVVTFRVFAALKPHNHRRGW